MKQVWCVLVQVLAASVLVGRFLMFSGRVGTTLGLERRGDLLNVGYAGLDLIPGGKSLFSSLQRELEVVGAGVAERVESRCRRDGREHGFHCR